MKKRISWLTVALLLAFVINFGVLLLALSYTPYGDILYSSKRIFIGKDPVVLKEDPIVIRKENNNLEAIIDYDNKVVIFNGKEIPFLIDEGEFLFDMEVSGTESVTIVPLDDSYDRFDVFVDDIYYTNNTVDLNAFFVDFAERFNLLESTTGWSSEIFNNGAKLQILVLETNGCYGGSATSGGAIFQFSNPLYKEIPVNCSKIGGTGELGNNWPYMGVAIHEVTHAISPLGIFNRAWLREGWGIYYEYNLLSLYGDISQSTADSTIFSGTGFYNWNDYVANDYLDTTINNNEIQESKGYSITAWMFSMLRDNKGLDWDRFYDLLENNIETLDKTKSLVGFGLTRYSLDMVIIDLFGRSLNMDFSEIKDVFEYDIVSDPNGWGVRNWTDEDRLWYADLTPTNLDFEDKAYYSWDDITLNATVVNTGDTSLTNVSVKFYSQYYENEPVFIEEKFVDVPTGGGSVLVSSDPFTIYSGVYTFRVEVDEDNVKIELDEDNNGFISDSLEVKSSGSGCITDKFGNRDCL